MSFYISYFQGTLLFLSLSCCYLCAEEQTLFSEILSTSESAMCSQENTETLSCFQEEENALASQQEKTREVPLNFLHDILMPIGIPTVSFYHAIRENLFLNTRVSQGNPIEVMGDLFLLPSRYLFAGKKVRISEENHYIWQQSHSYRKWHWLKVIGSLLSLPVSYTAGAGLKGISYLFPEVRRRHRALKRSLRTPSILSQLDAYKQQGLSDFYSDEWIPCQGHKRPSGLTKRQKVEISALREISEILNQYGIPHWIDCGTCLGAYRYGGIIPWDWDIDLSILVNDHDNVKRLLSTLDSKKYQIQDWSSYSKPKTFLKLFVKETKNFIDIYHYQINEQEQTVNYLFTYIDSPFPYSWKKSELKQIHPLPYEQVFPLKKAKFNHLTVWAPQDTESYLKSKYGGNLDPAMVWNEETQCYVKVEGHTYYQ